MNLSMKWLFEYVKPNASIHDYIHAMTMSGSKVEGYTTEGIELERVVVGKVLLVTPHPDSDHLVICKIDVGESADGPLQIVTGASNVVPNAMVPVALDKSRLPGGKEIKKGKLRGELSEGMLCSLTELGLTAHDFPYAIEDGIFLIEEDGIFPGQSIQSAIGLEDTSVEFEITPNRPDCLSILGLARETAATYRLPFEPHTPQVKGSGGDITEHLTVAVENQNFCPRYTARMVKNVKIAPSPRWMRERLRCCGVRPINNLVDITNYVMLEYGQPLHAFDANLLSEKDGKRHIVVRNAKKDEIIQTLDGIDRKLNEKMVVITDGEKPTAIAGVMGGENSAIVDTTTTVIFESANFLGSSVRTTSRDLGLRTESSGKYEKGLDPRNTLPAVMRACELVELLAAGEVFDGIIDIDASIKPAVKIKLEVEWINSFIGISVARSEMEAILTSLGCTIDGDDIIVPSYRADLENKADIAEEIARLYGYDKIPTVPLFGMAQGRLTPKQKFERRVHNVLQANGCFEICTYSFISPKFYDKINLPKEQRNSVIISNPLGEDTSVMRCTTLPSMLEVLSHNYANRNQTFFCYEIGNEYIPTTEDELPNENPQVTIGLYGDKTDFFTLKGIVERLLERLNLRNWDIEAANDDTAFHPGRLARIFKEGQLIGILGEVHPLVLENYSIDSRTYMAKLDFSKMFELQDEECNYKPLPKYPATTRDLSLVCNDETPILTIEKAIRAGSGDILEDLQLFDIYKGAQITSDKKSVSYSLTLRSATGTLAEAEIEAAMKRVLKELTKINVCLRG